MFQGLSNSNIKSGLRIIWMTLKYNSGVRLR